MPSLHRCWFQHICAKIVLSNNVHLWVFFLRKAQSKLQMTHGQKENFLRHSKVYTGTEKTSSWRKICFYMCDSSDCTNSVLLSSHGDLGSILGGKHTSEQLVQHTIPHDTTKIPRAAPETPPNQIGIWKNLCLFEFSLKCTITQSKDCHQVLPVDQGA
ncbi:hypothetical protein CapIbe_018117 [Capra ibex]